MTIIMTIITATMGFGDGRCFFVEAESLVTGYWGGPDHGTDW